MKTIFLWALIGIFCLRCSAEARDAVPSVQMDSGDESVLLPAEFYGIYTLDMRPAYGRNYQVYHLCPERVYLENHLADGRVIGKRSFIRVHCEKAIHILRRRIHRQQSA
jgi:hypothetical protein